MKKVVIKNLNEVQTHGGDFDTQELADAWIAQQKAKGSNCAWGLPAWTQTHDEDDNELETPIEHEDQFIIEITDITESVSEEQQRLEDLKFLADTDWYVIRFMETGVEFPLEISTQRQEARDRL